MSEADRERWNRKYSARATPLSLAPDAWLTTSIEDIPSGRALDLACGLGHNSIELTRRGWRVDAVDVSETGLVLARELADRHEADVNWITADLDSFQPAAAAYDLVLVFRFLDRAAIPPIVQHALKTGGLLIYETFRVPPDPSVASHIRNPAYLLQSGELPTLFPDFEVVEYQETTSGDGAVGRLLAKKPGS